MNQLSEILSELMAKQGINSAELARRTGIGQPVIHRLMSGVTDNPQVYTLLPIATYFNITIEQLIGTKSWKKGKLLDATSVHQINNQIVTIKTIASVLSDLTPNLLEGYIKASAAKLIKASIAVEMLPLLAINVENLMGTITTLQACFLKNKI